MHHVLWITFWSYNFFHVQSPLFLSLALNDMTHPASGLWNPFEKLHWTPGSLCRFEIGKHIKMTVQSVRYIVKFTGFFSIINWLKSQKLTELHPESITSQWEVKYDYVLLSFHLLVTSIIDCYCLPHLACKPWVAAVSHYHRFSSIGEKLWRQVKSRSK